MRGLLRTSVVCLLAAMISCGPGKKNPENGVTLTLYHWMEKDRAMWEEKIIKPFEQAHPGIHVSLQTSPYNLYVSKCLTSIASGNQLADLIFAEDWFGQELIRNQYCRNLFPYVQRDIAVRDFNTETFTEWRGVGQRENELFGFPASLGLTVLFYNKEMFDVAGLPYPDTTWTYDDLVRVGKQLTIDLDGDGVPEQWGLSFDVHYTGLETVLYSFGGRALTPDARHAVLTEPATIRGFEFVRDVFLTHRISANTTSYVNAWDSFAGRRAAMILIGSIGLTSLEGSSLRWDMTLPPKGPGGLRLSRRFTMAYMIPNNSLHP
jgi:multiple sugar transport system substrate-binding protein